ncbi:MAG: hypothetical protein ACPLX8_01330, partial [Nanopusillaceae archaeon]
MRVSLMTSFLQLLSDINELSFPAKIFELNRVAYIKNKHIIEEAHLLSVYSDYKVTINDSKKILERLMKELKLKYDIVESKHEFLIEGRQGDIYINNEKAGWIGEINPIILEKLNINYP